MSAFYHSLYLSSRRHKKPRQKHHKKKNNQKQTQPKRLSSPSRYRDSISGSRFPCLQVHTPSTRAFGGTGMVLLSPTFAFFSPVRIATQVLTLGEWWR